MRKPVTNSRGGVRKRTRKREGTSTMTLKKVLGAGENVPCGWTSTTLVSCKDRGKDKNCCTEVGRRVRKKQRIRRARRGEEENPGGGLPWGTRLNARISESCLNQKKKKKKKRKKGHLRGGKKKSIPPNSPSRGVTILLLHFFNLPERKQEPVQKRVFLLEKRAEGSSPLVRPPGGRPSSQVARREKFWASAPGTRPAKSVKRRTSTFELRGL